MRRNAAFMRGRTIPVLIAGLIGYLIGGWHPTALRTGGDASAADTVALRFPQTWDDASPAVAPPGALSDSGVLDHSGAATAAANTLNDAQLALLDPQPMIPQSTVPQIQQQPIAQTSQGSAPQQPAPQASVPQQPARLQLASAEVTARPPAFDSNVVHRPQPQQAMPARVQRPVKSAVAVERRPMSRPGYMLDDAQIASIKERLHLTPDQEQMWPAVEVALRNIAYTRAQQARGRTTPGAEIDPETVEGLKSAAVPLIMSFDDDQKQQVRNLAHVMGLDQLASQF